MTFSKEWDRCYENNTHMSVWPWSDLISFIMRYSSVKGPKFRVLELGCGAGANIPFFISLGVQYYSVEGSETMVAKVREKFPQFRDTIVVGDFVKRIPFKGKFDLVVDRTSLTHNTTRGIKRCLDLIHEKLDIGGKYIGIGWFSNLIPEYQKGEPDEDSHTRTKYQDGLFANVGRVHFSDKEHLLELFTKFQILVLEHKIIYSEIPQQGLKFASWNMVAQRK